jgi:hypothetical protein
MDISHGDMIKPDPYMMKALRVLIQPDTPALGMTVIQS